MNTTTHHRTLSLLFTLVLSACGSSGDEDPSSGLLEMAEALRDLEQLAPPPAEVQTIDYDLSSADPRWQGWTATAPAGARVMEDGVHGARLAADGLFGFDLSFAPQRQDLSELRRNVEAGAQMANGELTLSFLESTPDSLVWTVTGYGSTTYKFAMNLTAGDREVSCSNLMMGLQSEAELEQHRAACRTLRPTTQGS